MTPFWDCLSLAGVERVDLSKGFSDKKIRGKKWITLVIYDEGY